MLLCSLSCCCWPAPNTVQKLSRERVSRGTWCQCTAAPPLQRLPVVIQGNCRGTWRSLSPRERRHLGRPRINVTALRPGFPRQQGRDAPSDKDDRRQDKTESMWCLSLHRPYLFRLQSGMKWCLAKNSPVPLKLSPCASSAVRDAPHTQHWGDCMTN